MFRYRAIKKKYQGKNIWYLFSLKDCPALLWDDAFFLAGKPSSPVMLLNTIVRGHPTMDLFEGDYVYDNRTKEFLGIVVYDNGFYLQKDNSEFKKVIPTEHIYVRKGDANSIEILNTFKRTPIYFKYSGMMFKISDLVSVNGSILNIIVFKKHYNINVNNVRELLYYDEVNEESGYDGDFINGLFLNVDNVTSLSIN